MLAIIIPYFKLQFFEETLQSLADQTCKDFTVYIGDDASPEDCTLLLKQFEGQFDFVYHRLESNLGGKSLTKQWERCIALSGDEEWLMILGDDDVLGENVVEEFYKDLPVIKAENLNVIRFASQVINEMGTTISKRYQNPQYEIVWEFLYRKFEGNTRSSLSEYVFSKCSYEKVGFIDYPLAWHSDDQAWIDFSNSKPIFSMNLATVYIRNSDLNISGRKDNQSQKNQATLLFYKKNIYKYSKSQQPLILLEYEKILRKEKMMHLWNWFSILGMHLKCWNRYAIRKFLKRSVQKVLKNG